MSGFYRSSGPSRITLAFCLLGLASFLALEALLLRHFVAIDTRPPSWDQATHMEIALDYRETLSEGRWADMWFLAPKPGMPPFPPAFQLLLRGSYSSSDPAHAALWLNWFYMAILAVSLFAISWRFLPDSRALIATIAFCAAPGLQDLLSNQLVDLAVVAWTAAAYWALLESENFSRWIPALAFGVLHAVGMMHKWSFFSYMIPAYFVAGRGLGWGHARPKVAAAIALSIALSAPWYWSHIALLPTRLVQASADFAIPFWRGSAWASYLGQSCSALGPLVWALGFISLLAPQYARKRDSSWVLLYWFVTSYVFWTIVPNRQIRFLLPGLVPLGVAMAGTWPKTVGWGVVTFQMVAAVNFFFGFIGPWTIPMPFQPLTFFASQPPRREDWKLGEILRKVEADRDPTRPLTNVTLVANDHYFNGPTFHWAQRWLNLPHARVRGVNSRLCELSEFVLVKQGNLGPSSVIGGLPEAANVINESGGWFQRAYEKHYQWTLPDGSAAVLYRQRRNRARPFGRALLDSEFLESGNVRLANSRGNLGPWDPKFSMWPKVTLSAERVEVRGLVVRNVAASLQNFAVVSIIERRNPALPDWRDIRILRLDRIGVQSLEVRAEDLKAFIAARVRGLTITRLDLDQTIKASGVWKGRRIDAEAAIELDNVARRLRVKILSASYMGFSLPTALFRPIKELSISLDPNPETPFAIDVPSLTIKKGRLTIP